MDFKVLFSEQALSDLSEVVEYIAHDNPDAASRFGQSLINHVKVLHSFPRVGAPVSRRRKIRKLLHTPYKIYYRVHEARRVVEILHIWHSRRRRPKL